MRVHACADVCTCMRAGTCADMCTDTRTGVCIVGAVRPVPWGTVAGPLADNGPQRVPAISTPHVSTCRRQCRQRADFEMRHAARERDERKELGVDRAEKGRDQVVDAPVTCGGRRCAHANTHVDALCLHVFTLA